MLRFNSFRSTTKFGLRTKVNQLFDFVLIAHRTINYFLTKNYSLQSSVSTPNVDLDVRNRYSTLQHLFLIACQSAEYLHHLPVEGLYLHHQQQRQYGEYQDLFSQEIYRWGLRGQLIPTVQF